MNVGSHRMRRGKSRRESNYANRLLFHWVRRDQDEIPVKALHVLAPTVLDDPDDLLSMWQRHDNSL